MRWGLVAVLGIFVLVRDAETLLPAFAALEVDRTYLARVIYVLVVSASVYPLLFRDGGGGVREGEASSCSSSHDDFFDDGLCLPLMTFRFSTTACPQRPPSFPYP